MASFPTARLNFGDNNPTMAEEGRTPPCKNASSLRRSSPLYYLDTYISNDSLSLASLSHFLVPSIHSNNKHYNFLVFLFSGAHFG